MPYHPDHLWRAVADLSGLLLSEETTETTLKRVNDLAVRSIEHCTAAGVTLVEGAKATSRAATGGLAYEVDHYQYDISEGPCLQAILDSEVIAVEEMATETRWPRFCAHAAERGIHASLSFPLLARGKALGALNLYAHQPGAFKSEDRELGAMFASQAAVALANIATYTASVELTGQLREALDSRAVIDQAMGILIGANGYNQELAFKELRIASQAGNRRLQAVAQDMVHAAQNRAAKN